MKDRTTSFIELVVWQKAHSVVLLIYKLTSTFPQEEAFGLTSQLRRSALSITSNIAEGFGRIGKKEKQRFYYISVGSIRELQNQIILARDLNYINETQFVEINDLLIEVAKMLSGYIKKLS